MIKFKMTILLKLTTYLEIADDHIYIISYNTIFESVGGYHCLSDILVNYAFNFSKNYYNVKAIRFEKLIL